MSFLKIISSGLITSSLLLQNVPIMAQTNFYEYVKSHNENEICSYVLENEEELAAEYDLTDYKKLSSPNFVWRSIKADKSLNCANLSEKIKKSSKSLIFDREYLPENYLYYYRNDYNGTGGKKRVLINQNGPFSSYSTYGLTTYGIEDIPMICDIKFSLYANAIPSDRTAGRVFGSVYAGDFPKNGEYDESSEEYKSWTDYFQSRQNPLYEIRLNQFPDTQENWVYGGMRNGKEYYNYTGFLTYDISKIISELSGDSAVIAMSNGAGENVSLSFNTSKLITGIDLTADTENKYAVRAVNNAVSGENLYTVLSKYADYFDINLSDNSIEVCGKMLEAKTEFTKESVKTEFETAAGKLQSEAEAMAAVNGLEQNAGVSELTDVLKRYNGLFGIEDKYFSKLNNMSGEKQSAAISGFLSVDYDNAAKVREMFENWVFDDTEYTDKAVFSTDFDNDREFAKYFLSTVNTDSMQTVKALYDSRDYAAALKEYRNITLDKLRSADLDKLSYHDTVYNNKQWGGYFTGMSAAPSASNGYDILIKCNFAGSPDSEINPDWSYSVKFPEQSQMTDLSYFNCLSPLAAMYFDTNNPIYLRKWMQITDVFAREHKRWINENYPDDKNTNLCWNYKAAQSTLNQANRTETIIKMLGAFSKLSDKTDKPLSWSALLEPRNPVNDTSVYDVIDETEFANIVMSLVYDHSEALVERYVPCTATPNQVFAGLTALTYCDYFFGSRKYTDDYSRQVENGFNNYTEMGFYPDGGMVEQAFNYNNGDLSSVKALSKLFGNEKPMYIEKLNFYAENARKIHESIAFPNGKTPTVGMGGINISSNYLTDKNFTSIAFPYIGFYSMRSGWGENDTSLFMQSPRRTSGHLYPSSNGIELYAKGRLMLMNGGNPWYSKNMAPADQAAEFDRYNEYFGENSTMNRNTVVVDGAPQNNGNYDGKMGTPKAFTDTVGNMWHTSDSFDYVSSDYDGGYGKVYGYKHNRQVIYVKDIDMNIISDSVSSINDTAKCEAIWNFEPYLTKENDGTDVNGFAENEVEYDENEKTVKTSDSDNSNLFMYQFYPEQITYKKYYGYKGEDGYKGFYANNFGRRYPKVDIHTEWTENGKQIPLVTLMETSFDTSSVITEKNDLSVNQNGKSYSGFGIKTQDCEVIYFSGNSVCEYPVTDGFSIKAKSVTAVKKSGKIKILAIGARDCEFENFEAELADNQLINFREIGIPSDFSWNGNEPSYGDLKQKETLSNVKIKGMPYFGSTLTAEYEYSGNDENLKFQWYSSTDNKSWELINGASEKNYYIPNYNINSVPKYYTVLVKDSCNTAFAYPTEASHGYFDDFESGKMTAIYNDGSDNTNGNSYSIKKEAVTENGNTFLRFDYDDFDGTGAGGIGFQHGKSDVYLNRWWKPVDTLCVEQVSFRINGNIAKVMLSFMKTLLEINGNGQINYYSSDGNGSFKDVYTIEQNKWYTVKCLINPTEESIGGIPAKSYKFAVKAKDEESWTVSEIYSLPDGDYSLNGLSNSMTQNDGKGNRFYIYMGSKSERSKNTVDIDDLAVIPVVSIEQTDYFVEYGEKSDTVNCRIDLKNNDATQQHDKTVAAAVYENDALKGIKLYNTALGEDEEKELLCSVGVEPQNSDRCVKCFIFDDFAALMVSDKPLIKNNYK